MNLGWRLCAAALVCVSTSAWSKTIAADEMTQASRWARIPQFSFVYDGRNSDDLLRDWTLKKSSRKLDKKRTESTLTWADAKTGLIVRCVAVKYSDFPTVEWTLYFRNSGSADTPIIENIQALDARIERGKGIDSASEFVLNHFRGSNVKCDDYEPLQTALKPGAQASMSATDGRPSVNDWPYFNLEWQGQGAIVAVGWPGQWSATFTRDDKNGLRVRAGQELTHFKLLPGEEVRSPLIVMQFWKGDRARSYNVWRRWMLAHNVPRPGGKLPKPEMCASTVLPYDCMTHATEKNQIEFIDRFIEKKIKIGYWWMTPDGTPAIK
jgi:alpha-galactosidase